VEEYRMLHLLYGYGADLSERDKYNRAPLLIAMATSQWGMVLFMLDSGVDLYESGVFDNSFRCKLMFLTLYSDDDVWPMEISELLLDRGLLNEKNGGTSNFILSIHQGLNILILSGYCQ
jgi:ankyrin repeat protein